MWCLHIFAELVHGVLEYMQMIVYSMYKTATYSGYAPGLHLARLSALLCFETISCERTN